MTENAFLRKRPLTHHARAALGLMLIAPAFLAALPALAQSNTPREETWVTNGPVLAIATTPTTIYIGGAFTWVGPVGGTPGVDGVYRNGIAALDAKTGKATDWNPNASATLSCPPVEALAVSGDGATVYAGGYFTTIGGQTRNHFAALDAKTGQATDWNPNPSGGGSRQSVSALAMSDDSATVYAGGRFTTIGGQKRNGIAALDAVTGQATDWNPKVMFTDWKNHNVKVMFRVESSVSALALSDDGTTVYAGGWFSSIGGQPRNNIAAIDAVAGQATTWNPDAADEDKRSSFPGSVSAWAVSDTTVYAGGVFNGIGREKRNHLVALDAATGLAADWNPNADKSIAALAVSGDGRTVYAGGWFSVIGGQGRNCIAALDAATGRATDWNPNVDKMCGMNPDIIELPYSTTTGHNRKPRNSNIFALALSGTTLYVGGTFETIDGKPRPCFAQFDAVEKEEGGGS
ncbi:MAG TPA: hypothetical protein VMZ06_01850 [Candidatus Bathyarchaeia archaeon]|nr:hypothetical protein [Candidatus Bathyarchaeia archaeon]